MTLRECAPERSLLPRLVGRQEGQALVAPGSGLLVLNFTTCRISQLLKALGLLNEKTLCNGAAFIFTGIGSEGWT